MEVDLDAIVRNAGAARSRAGVPLIPMVKADAYGLGAEAVARALEAVDPYGYGIATVAEGRTLTVGDGLPGSAAGPSTPLHAGAEARASSSGLILPGR